MTCRKCGLEETDKLVSCRKCDGMICHDCTGLSTTEVRCLQLKRRVLIYECDDCPQITSGINEGTLKNLLEKILQKNLQEALEVMLNEKIKAMEHEMKEIKKLCEGINISQKHNTIREIEESNTRNRKLVEIQQSSKHIKNNNAAPDINSSNINPTGKKTYNEATRQGNEDELKRMQKTQQNIMNRVINLKTGSDAATIQTESRSSELDTKNTLSDKDPNNEGFQMVKSRRRQRSTIIQGVAQGTELSIKGVPSYGYLHVYRLDPGTTEEALTAYLTTMNIKYPVCTKLSAKHPEIYSSFKVSFDINDLEKLQHPDFWPKGTRVNRFFHRIPQKERTV